MTLRREIAVALVLVAAGAALLLLAAGRPWLQAAFRVAPTLPVSRVVLTGHDLVPAQAALGLVGLAGTVAVAATRGWARRAVGGVLALIGLWSAGLSAVYSSTDNLVAQAVARTEQAASAAQTAHRTIWPLVALVGSLLLLGGGLLVAARGQRWPGMSARYERRPAGDRRTTDPWTAIDRGEDPTV